MAVAMVVWAKVARFVRDYPDVVLDIARSPLPAPIAARVRRK